MSQWYLSKNGQALGPFDTEKLIAMIKAKEVNHIDLVYRSGDTQWLPMAQVAELSEYLNTSQEVKPAQAQPSAEAVWVLLKKVKTEKSKEYKQIGPFTEDQVIELIDRGEIKFTDFAWKKGLETWVKISELEEFDQPLPSSPNIDVSLYEKTVPDFQMDSEERASMTEMVKIERFDHKSTTKSIVKPKPSLENLDAEATRIVPFNATESVEAEAQSEINIKNHEETEVNLWSLEPPSAEKDQDQESTRIVAKSDRKVKSQPREKIKEKTKAKRKDPFEERDLEHPRTQVSSRSSRRNSEKNLSLLSVLSKDNAMWFVAAGFFVFATATIYLSFRQESAEIIYEEAEQSQIIDSYPSPAKKPASVPNPTWKQNVPAVKIQEKQVKIERVEALPAEELAEISTSEVVEIETKIESIKEEKELPDIRKIASPKTQPPPKKKAAGSVKEKAKPAKKEVKAVPTSPPVAVKKTKTEGGSLGSPAKGSAKAVSYYKQRDRKALFYSSLKAETLAVEIEGEFKKLKDNKNAWNRFYSQWRKKVSVALASDIRDYPVRNETYGYPTIMASFKKDYSLFYKYGESFNAKVMGGRTPSDAPNDMRSLFSRYKNQAQSLN